MSLSLRFVDAWTLASSALNSASAFSFTRRTSRCRLARPLFSSEVSWVCSERNNLESSLHKRPDKHGSQAREGHESSTFVTGTCRSRPLTLPPHDRANAAAHFREFHGLVAERSATYGYNRAQLGFHIIVTACNGASLVHKLL